MPTHLISVMLRTILVLLLYWKLIILDRYAGNREALKTNYCYFQVAGKALANVLTGQYNPAGIDYLIHGLLVLIKCLT